MGSASGRALTTSGDVLSSGGDDDAADERHCAQHGEQSHRRGPACVPASIRFHQRACSTCDNPSEMSSNGNARHHERDQKVHEEQRPDAGVHRIDPTPPESDRCETHQPKDGSRCPSMKSVRLKSQRPCRPTEDRGEVDDAERNRAERTLEHAPQLVQQEHVEREMDGTEVNEPRCCKAVPILGAVNKWSIQAEIGVQRRHGAVERGGVGNRHYREDRDIHSDDGTGERTRVAGRPLSGTDTGSGSTGSAAIVADTANCSWGEAVST